MKSKTCVLLVSKKWPVDKRSAKPGARDILPSTAIKISLHEKTEQPRHTVFF